MAKITETQLVWPGKYREDGTLVEAPRANLPLQTAEVFGRRTEEWKNKLIWGDNLLVMGSLLKDFAGKVDLIYIDPPFATGSDFPIGQHQVAYRDSWKVTTGGYLGMMAERLRLIRDLLSPTGSLFLHCDWHVSHLLRAIGDEVFGAENFLNEIVWYYYNKFQGNVNRFASNHDVVFWYRKSASYQFHQQVERRAEGTVKQLVRQWDKQKAAIVNARGADGKVKYRETDHRTVDDVWRLPMLQPADRTENCGFPTQKPEALLRRIVETASSEGDLIADFFCGSGTMLAVAEKLARRWIGCDFGRWGIHTTRKRLLGIKEHRPFEVMNLGKEEREHWQSSTFGAGSEYVEFMLRLYGAVPVAGCASIHGKKNKVLVHVGKVDAPIGSADIDAAVDACLVSKRRELHLLGWDWEKDAVAGAGTYKGIKLLLLQIPREVMEPQAAAKGDVRFCPLAYIDAEIEQSRGLEVRVLLKDFVLPESTLKEWSDSIDSWCVDWDFQEPVFAQGWAAYRTRKERRLPLTSGSHTYAVAGRHHLLIRVIDIFGNETRQALEVDLQQP